MNLKYLFFCKNCGAPQEIHEYVVKVHMVNPRVPGYHCDNCKEINFMSPQKKMELIQLVYKNK